MLLTVGLPIVKQEAEEEEEDWQHISLIYIHINNAEILFIYLRDLYVGVYVRHVIKIIGKYLFRRL